MLITPPQSPSTNEIKYKTCDSSAIKVYKAKYMNQLLQNNELLKDLALITRKISATEMQMREKLLKISNLEFKLKHNI
jgi:hypothetical protein